MLWHCCFNSGPRTFHYMCVVFFRYSGMWVCVPCSSLSSEVWLLAIESGDLSLYLIFVKLIHFWKKPSNVQSKLILCFQLHLAPCPPSILLLSGGWRSDVHFNTRSTVSILLLWKELLPFLPAHQLHREGRW